MVKLLFLFLLNHAFSGSIEEQRKYSFAPNTPETQIETLLASTVDGYSFYRHSRFQTHDIYLDTPDLTLKKAGYSFRLRRVEKNQNPYEYAIQFKREMTTFGSSRIEVEYKDFSKQFVQGEPVREVIDHLIESPQDKTNALKISKWIELKKSSSLPPFQTLRDLKFSQHSFAPKVLGYSVRARAHIYVDKKRTVDFKSTLKPSQKAQKFLDSYFKENPEKIWLMEASWDISNFQKVPADGATFRINELEIENKFRPRAKGTLMLDDLESKLIQKYKIKPQSNSKYSQAAEALLHE